MIQPICIKIEKHGQTLLTDDNINRYRYANANYDIQISHIMKPLSELTSEIYITIYEGKRMISTDKKYYLKLLNYLKCVSILTSWTFHKTEK